MNDKNIPEEIKQFIFSDIDSVEQVEIILLLRQHPEKLWTARSIAEELRTSTSSVANRLERLRVINLVEERDEAMFRYRPGTPEAARLINEFAEIYRVRKHRILELIFSPMKKARTFADAFLITGTPKKEEDDNG